MRVSAPHHSESHGIIERHNRSHLDILKCFGDTKTWRDYYAAAFESYNRGICAALSKPGARFSPIEMWRPGHKVTPYNVPIAREPTDNHKYAEHFEQQRQLTQMRQMQAYGYNQVQ